MKEKKTTKGSFQAAAKSDPLGLIPSALSKTGFPLEHAVSVAFGNSGWNLISNRFYVDDVDGKARELDLIAYKSAPGKETTVVTTLLISCKKDQSHWWSFLTRPRPKQDPNTDWTPAHFWTNNELLESYLKEIDWKNIYFDVGQSDAKNIFEINRQAFAFQLVTLDGMSPKNDTPIFDSIAGLMKALDYELSSLKSRSKENRIYNFHLLTVADAKLVEVQYEDSTPKATEIKEFKHIARYVVRKQQVTTRINFFNVSQLDEQIKNYNALAIHDHAFFNSQTTKAFSAIKDYSSIQKIFSKMLTKKLKWPMNHVLIKNKEPLIEGDFDIHFDKTKNELVISLSTSADGLSALIAHTELNATISSTLKSLCRYEGAYRLDWDIPF